MCTKHERKRKLVEKKKGISRSWGVREDHQGEKHHNTLDTSMKVNS